MAATKVTKCDSCKFKDLEENEFPCEGCMWLRLEDNYEPAEPEKKECDTCKHMAQPIQCDPCHLCGIDADFDKWEEC